MAKEVVVKPIKVEILEQPIETTEELYVPDGMVLIQGVNDGELFIYPESQYKRFYSDPSKFTVKKKGNKLKKSSKI